MALTIGQHAQGRQTDSGHGVVSLASPIAADDVIILFVSVENTPDTAEVSVLNVTDTVDTGSSGSAGLTWSKRTSDTLASNAFFGGAYMSLEIWWAHVPAGLTGIEITAETDDVLDSMSLVAMTVSGFANPLSPWDVNVDVPASANNPNSFAMDPTINGLANDATNSLWLAVYTTYVPTGLDGGVHEDTGSGWSLLEKVENSDSLSGISSWLWVSTRAWTIPQLSFNCKYIATVGNAKGWVFLVDVLAEAPPVSSASEPPAPPPVQCVVTSIG